jgi:N-formylglutamate deformylase
MILMKADTKRSINSKLFSICIGEGPILATALHSAHALRDELAKLTAVDEATRLREEDPYTDQLADVAPSQFIFCRSRFEVDLNRARNGAVYGRPEDAWGLNLWKHPLPRAMIERSLAEYDACYRVLRAVLQNLEQAYGRFIVLDIHCHNHRRAGPNAPPEPAASDPEVDVATGTMDRNRWAKVVDRLIVELREFDFCGRHLDVRENVKFKGGHLEHWIHTKFPASGCAIEIELKKFFMDEWSGEVDQVQLAGLRAALEYVIPKIVDEL